VTRIQVVSDFHHDVEPVRPDVKLSSDADVLVVAGDVCEGMENAFVWLRKSFGWEVPIVCVAGNHSFYRRSLKDELNTAIELAAHYKIDFLENTQCEIAGVRFLGCTLWTDYCLMGEPFRASAMHEASAKMNDHKKISFQKQPWRRFRPHEAAALHAQSRQFLIDSVRGGGQTPTVVVTHHAPSIKSVAPLHKDALLTSAYASSLETLIDQSRASVWIHGHLHNSSDYMISDTRIVCNPHGYGQENPGFEPEKIVDV
jgi:Icc-related predicted phosphoesterase